MNKILKTVLNIVKAVITLLLIIIILFNLYTLYMRYVKGEKQPVIMGYSYAVVISGSMADTINTDDMIITRRADKYNVGDIIMFNSGTSVVTHRIADIVNGEYITKGDANNASDPDPVNISDIKGKVEVIIPEAGKLIYFFTTPAGMLIMVLALFLILELPHIMYDKYEVMKE